MSTVSFYDYVSIVWYYYSTFVSDKDYTTKTLKDRGYTDKQIHEVFNKRDGSFTPIEIANLRFTKPLDDIDYENFDYISLLYDNYKRGVMPFKGCLTEQPAQLIEIFSLLGYLEQYREKIIMKKQRAANGRK